MREVRPKWSVGCVFVCTHERPPGAEKASCGRERGEALRDWMKAEVRARGLGGPVLVAKSGCLGVCAREGTTVAVLPAPETGRPKKVLVADPEGEREALLESVLACLPPLDG